MVIKCSGCWQIECICGTFGTSPVKNSFFGMVVEIKDEVFMKCCSKSAYDCVCMEIDDAEI